MEKHFPAVFTQFAVRTDIAVQGDARNPQFLTQVTDLGVPVAHGRLGKPDLRLAQAKFSPTFAPSGTSRL
jgi:hypothetical protein